LQMQHCPYVSTSSSSALIEETSPPIVQELSSSAHADDPVSTKR
jgi:hypothetical protein